MARFPAHITAPTTLSTMPGDNAGRAFLDVLADRLPDRAAQIARELRISQNTVSRTVRRQVMLRKAAAE